MFESEQAAKSRLQFISQLAGSTAGLSMLAACGGSGLLDSRGNPISSSEFAASDPSPGIIAHPPLVDTPEFQKLMFQTDCRAVTQDGIAIIRDDLKSNIEYVNRINARLTLDSLSRRKHEKLSPSFLGDDGDEGGDLGGGWGGDDGGGGDHAPNYYDDWPKQWYYAYIDMYGSGDWYGDVAFVGIFSPYMSPGPTYFTQPSQRPNCTLVWQKALALAQLIYGYCKQNPYCGVPEGCLIKWAQEWFKDPKNVAKAVRLCLAALTFLAANIYLPYITAIGAVILLWWLVGCPT